MSEDTQSNIGNDRALVFISAFLLIVVGFLLYYPSFSLPLHGEDQVRFVDDASLHRISTYTDALHFWPTAPLTVFGYALNWVMLPLGGAGLHIINVLLHVLSGVFLYLIARKLLRKDFPEPIAMLPGLALIVHPLCTESVNYLSARPALQAACFALLATLLYLHALGQDSPRPLLIAGALTFYVLAFASSFVLLGLPLIWIGLGRIHSQAGASERGRAEVFRTLSLSSLSIMVALLVAVQASRTFETINTPSGLTPIVAAQSHIAAGLKHITGGNDVLAALAGSQSIDTLGLLILAECALLGLCVFFRVSFGAPAWWAFIALTSIPCLADKSEALGEAQLYFPLAGLFLFLALILHKITLPVARYFVSAILVAFLCFNSYQSFTRTLAWSDPLTFWGDAALEHPELIQPRLYQGRYLMALANSVEDPEQAKPIFDQAKTVWSAAERVDALNVEALAGLGESLIRLDELDTGIAKLEAALLADPFFPKISLLLALAYEKKVTSPSDTEMLRKVAASFKRADAQDALPPQARSRYGMALLTLGELDAAFLQLRQAQNEDPKLPFAESLAGLEKRLGEAQQIGTQAMKAFQEKPDQPDGIILQARADMLRGASARAFYLLDRAITKYPDNQDSWMLSGAVRAHLNDAVGFIRDSGEKFSGNREFWVKLAVECAGSSNWAAAIAYLNHAQQWAQPGSPSPQVQLAGIAIALNQIPMAQRLAEEATRLQPDSPEPWLILAQIAVAAKNTDDARNYLKEAETRGANAATLKKIQEQGSVDMNETQAPVRTIIR